MRVFIRNPQITRTPIEILNDAKVLEMAAINVTQPDAQSDYKIEKADPDYLVKVKRGPAADYQDRFRLNADGRIEVTSDEGVSWTNAVDDSLTQFNFVIAEFDRINTSNRAEEERQRQQQGIQERLQEIKDRINFVAPRVSFDILGIHYECSRDADDLIIRKVTGDRVDDFVRIETAANGSISFSKKGAGAWVQSTEFNDVAVLEGALINRTPIEQPQADMDDICRAMPANVEVRIGDDAFIRTVNGAALTLHSYRYADGLVEGTITVLAARDVPQSLRGIYIARTAAQPVLRDARELAADFIAVLDRDIIDGGNKVTKSTERLSGLLRTVYNFDGKKYYQAAVGGILHEVDAGRDVALDSIGVVGRTVGIKGKFDLNLTDVQRDERKAITESVKKAGWTGSFEIPVPAGLSSNLLDIVSGNSIEIDVNSTKYRCSKVSDREYSIVSVDGDRTTKVFKVDVPPAGNLSVKKVPNSRIPSVRSSAGRKAELEAYNRLLADVAARFEERRNVNAFTFDESRALVAKFRKCFIDNTTAEDYVFTASAFEYKLSQTAENQWTLKEEAGAELFKFVRNPVNNSVAITLDDNAVDAPQFWKVNTILQSLQRERTAEDLTEEFMQIMRQDKDVQDVSVRGKVYNIYSFEPRLTGKQYYSDAIIGSGVLHEYDPATRVSTKLTSEQIAEKIAVLKQAQVIRGVEDQLTQVLKNRLIAAIKAQLSNHNEVEAIRIANQFLGSSHEANPGSVESIRQLMDGTNVKGVLRAFAHANFGAFAASNNPNLRNLAGVFCELGIHDNSNVPNPVQALGHYQEAANTGSQAAMDNVIRCYKDGVSLDAVVSEENKKKFARRGTTLEALRWAVENQVIGVHYNRHSVFAVNVNGDNSGNDIYVNANTGFDALGLEERIKEIERQKESTRGIIIPDGLDESMLIDAKEGSVALNLGTTYYLCSKDGSGYNVIDQNNGGKFGYRVTFKEGLPTVTKIEKKDRASTLVGYSEYKAIPFAPKDHAEFAAIIRNRRRGFDEEIKFKKDPIVADIDAAKVVGQPTVEELKTQVRRLIDPTEADDQKLAEATKIVESFLGISDSFVDQTGKIHFYGQHVEIGEKVKKVLDTFAKANRVNFAASVSQHLKLLAFNFYYTDEEPIVDGNRTAQEAAFKIVKTLATGGNLEAKNRLGVCYQEGFGVKKDAAKARELFKKAADQGSPTAYHALATTYDDDIATLGTRSSYYRTSANLGLFDGMHQAGMQYLENHTYLFRDYTKAVQYFQEAANHGHAPSLYQLGVCYEKGIGGTDKKKPQEDDRKTEAFRLYKAAAELGDSSAIESLARCYEKGIGTIQNTDLATRLNSLLLIMQIGAEVEHSGAKYKVEFDKDRGFVVRDVDNPNQKFVFSVENGFVSPNPNVNGNENAILVEINTKAANEKREVEARKTTRIQQTTRQVTGAIRTPEKLEGEKGRELLERASENQTEVCYLGQNYRCFFVRNHDGTIAHDSTAEQKKNSYVLYPIDHEEKREESKPRYEISFSGNPLSTTVTKLNSTVLGRNLGLNLSLFGESRASVVNISSEDGFFAKLVDKIDTVERSRQTNFIVAGECQAVTDLALEDFVTVNPNDNVRASFINYVYGEEEKYEITRYGDDYQFDKIINNPNDGEKATRSYKIIDPAGNPPILQIPDPDDVNRWINCDDSAEFAKAQKLLVALDSVNPATAPKKITKQDAQYRDALRRMGKDQQYSLAGQFFIKTVGEGGSTTLYQYERDGNGLVINIRKDPKTATEQLPDKAFLHDVVTATNMTDITGLNARIKDNVRNKLNEAVNDDPIPAGYSKKQTDLGEKYTYSAKGVEYCIEGGVLHKVEYVVDEKEWLTIQSPKPYYKATPLNAFEIVQASSDFIARQQQEADDLVIKGLIAAVRGYIPGEAHAAEEKATQIVHDFLGFNNLGTRLYPTARPDNEVSPAIKTILCDFAVDQITNHAQFTPADRVVALAGHAPEFSSPALLKNIVAVFCENNVGLARGHLRPDERMEAARDLYNESATAGNPHAQNNLGRLTESGVRNEAGTADIIAQNREEALKLYQQAAAQGNKTGFENVARCNRSGIGLRAQDENAADTLEVMQWATGHADLKDKRWRGWVRGEEYSVSEYNPQKGFVVRNSWNQEIARVKHDGYVVKVEKGKEVGGYHNFSAIVKQIKGRKEERVTENHILEGNVEKAQEALVIYLQKTPPNPAPMNQVKAQEFAKRFFESVTEGPERYQAKSELLASLTPEQRARLEEFTHAHVVAFSKSKSAQLKDLAGQIYFNGIGVDKDYAKARKCLEESVNKSYPMAEYHLAEMYLIGGRGVEKDERQAFAKFEVAARQGFQPAIAALANCYMDGVGCERNLALAEALYDDDIRRNNLGIYTAIAGIPSVNLVLYPEFAAGVAEFKLKSGSDQEALDILRVSPQKDPRLYAKIGKIYERDHQENSFDVVGNIVVTNVLANDVRAAEQYDLGARAGATNSMRALADLYDQGRVSNSVLARSEYHADKLRKVANFFESCAQLQGSEDIRIAVPSSSSTKYLRGAKDVYQVSKAADGSYILSIDGKEKNGFKVDGKGNFYVRKEINGVVRDIYEERGFQENPVFLKVQNAMILSNNEQVRVSASGIEDHILQDLTKELNKINVANPEMFARDFLGLNPESGDTFGGNNDAATLRYCYGNNFREINNVAVREVLTAFAVKNRKYCEASGRPHLRNLAGMFYEMSLFTGGIPNYVEARNHYQKAADKGYVPAEHNLVHANHKDALDTASGNPIDTYDANIHYFDYYKLVANKGYLPSVKAAADIISDPNVLLINPALGVQQENAEFLSNLAEMRIAKVTTIHINDGTVQQKSYVVSDYDPETGFTLNLIDRTGLKSKEGFRVASLADPAPQIHKIGANGRDMQIDGAAQKDLTEILTVLKRNNKQVAQQDKQCLDSAHKPTFSLSSVKKEVKVADVEGVQPSLKKPSDVHKEKEKKEVPTPEVLKKVKPEVPKVKVDPNLIKKAVPKSSCIVSAAMTLRMALGRAR